MMKWIEMVHHIVFAKGCAGLASEDALGSDAGFNCPVGFEAPKVIWVV